MKALRGDSGNYAAVHLERRPGAGLASRAGMAGKSELIGAGSDAPIFPDCGACVLRLRY